MDAGSGNLGMARTGTGLGRGGEALVRPKTATSGTGSGVPIVKEVKKEEGAKQDKAKSQEVQHREIQGGFERIHVPSIDLTTIVNAEHATEEASVVGETVGEKEKEEPAAKKEKEKEKEKEKLPASRSSLPFVGVKSQALDGNKDSGRTTPTPTPANAKGTTPGSPTSPWAEYRSRF
ncbi:hypothetical protein FRC10_012273 [Ceratobasidium sp. 414]|nr:hypothetical protein FRC10_012273 [Ceratobasidium sp. 414]